jgi:hypothetical protein
VQHAVEQPAEQPVDGAVDAEHSAVDAEHSAVDAEHSAVDAEHSAVDAEHSAVDAYHTDLVELRAGQLDLLVVELLAGGVEFRARSEHLAVRAWARRDGGYGAS